MVFSYLSEIYGPDEAYKIFNKLKLYKYLKYGQDEVEILRTLYYREKTLTSSLGRFLDAIATLLEVCGLRTYEGEPAMKLEAVSLKSVNKDPLDIDFKLIEVDGKIIIDQLEAFRQALEYYLNGIDISRIAFSVQYNLGRALGEAALRARKRGIEDLVLSGGAAVNEIIMRGIEDALNDKLRLKIPSRVPVNDGGISAGQAIIAACVSSTRH
jgi:hydrogenase maturation protein HypF